MVIRNQMRATPAPGAATFSDSTVALFGCVDSSYTPRVQSAGLPPDGSLQLAPAPGEGDALAGVCKAAGGVGAPAAICYDGLILPVIDRVRAPNWMNNRPC